MTELVDLSVPRGLADEPLEVRRARDIEKQRELQEGFTRRHLAEAAEERAITAASYASLLNAGRSGQATS